MHSTTIECPACHQQRHPHMMHAPETVPPHFQRLLQTQKPDWMPEDDVCEMCINEAKASDVEHMLIAESNGELTALEREIIQRLRIGGKIPQNIAEMDEDENLTFSERIADRVANTIGTFSFSATVLLAVSLWLWWGMATGTIATQPAVVFGGLSGALGTLAAIQNPIILMSQRRATRRDRLRNENDYLVNLKSELEVRYINAKLDFMLEKLDAIHKNEIAQSE